MAISDNGRVTVTTVDEETGAHTRSVTVTVHQETWRGDRLARVAIRDTESCERTTHVFVDGVAAQRMGEALCAIAAGDRTDDRLEPWDRTVLPSSAYIEAMVDALADPMAASVGHKHTLRAARLLAAEVLRLQVVATNVDRLQRLADAERAYRVELRDHAALISDLRCRGCDGAADEKEEEYGPLCARLAAELRAAGGEP